MKRNVVVAALTVALLFGTFTVANAALVGMSVSPLSSDTVYHGGSLSFMVTYTGDIDNISLCRDDISFTGFDAEIDIDGYSCGDNERIVELSNITPDGSGNENRIFIKEGTAVSSDGHMANSAHTAAFTISAPIELGNGRCGDNAFWYFMSDGILTIYGEGSTWDIVPGGDSLPAWKVPGIEKSNYNDYMEYLSALWDNKRNIENPWFTNGYRTANGEYDMHDMGGFNNQDVRKVVVKKGITRIGDELFYDNGFIGYENLDEVIIEEGVKEIGEGLINYNDYVVVIPRSVEKISPRPRYSGARCIIKGYLGSFAETYANENDINFINMEAGSLNIINAPSKIIINGQLVPENLQYPFILYHNITYFPLTYQNCLFAGLECKLTDKGLIIDRVAPGDYRPELGSPSSLKALPAEFDVFVADRDSGEYIRVYNNYRIPIILCNDVTYIPMDWEIVTSTLGWNFNYVYDENGGVITIDTAPVPEEPENIPENI